MLRTLRNHFVAAWAGLLLVSFPTALHAQKAPRTPLKAFLNELEDRYEIKFSYVDEDVTGVEITPPATTELEAVLQYLENQTQIKIQKLNERYYTLVKSTLVDICGRVLDNFAENTVPGATVEVLDSDIALITDNAGNFQIDQVPRSGTLKVRFLGYITKYIPIDDLVGKGGCPEILLAQNYEKLEEVIVYEYLTSGIVKEDDASITLNTGELGILPGLIEPDVLQTVQALPGIKSIDETVSDINVRGGTNDQNLILWNGIKMYQSGHFFGLISAFNPYLTNQVHVYKNGTPARFGDGVSSVISMWTKNEIDGASTGGAGFNFISGDLYGQFPLNDRMAFQISARRSTTDFLDTPVYDEFQSRVFQNSEVKNQQNQSVDREFDRDITFFFWDVSGKFLYDINDDHKLRLSFIGIDNDLLYTETNRESNETSQSFLDQTNISVGAQLQDRWTDKLSTDINAYYTQYQLEALGVSPNPRQQLTQRNRIIETSIKINSTYKLSEALTLGNGYQFIETGIRNFTRVTAPQFESNIKGVVRVHAPYSEITYRSFDDTFVATAGVRANHIANLGTFSKLTFEPRLNLSFKLANYLRAEVLGEFKSQYTNQVIDLEQNFLGVEKRRWVLSDEDELPVTQSKQGSIGLNYAKNRFYFGLEGFYKNVEGISTSTQGFQNENQFNGEIGSYEVKGVEFLINKKGDNYSAWLSYTYNKNDYTFEDVDPNTFPNNLDVRHTVTVAGTYDINSLKLGLGLNYRTGKPYTKPDEQNPLVQFAFPTEINYQSPNSSRLPEYFRLDASATYSFEISRRVKANAGVSLLNLTNRENVLNRYYQVSDDDEIEQVNNLSLGLTPNFSFRLRF